MNDLLPTVADLQTQRTQKLSNALRTIGNEIRTKENNGYRNFSYWPKANEPIDEIIAELVKHGYAAKEKTDPDPRDGGMKYIEISWS